MSLPKYDLAAGTAELYADPAYYDHEFGNRSDDVDWYVERYLEAGEPVLELGVGSGRVAAKAVRQGATVVGLDLSHAMLAEAARRKRHLPKKRRPHLQLFRADMRDFALDRRFGLVSCPFNAFQHLYTREDVERCLARVREHLTPDGLFVLDVLQPDLDYLTRSPFKRYEGSRFKHPSLGVHYVYSEQSAYDPVNQINQMWFHYDLADEDPGDAPEYFCVQLSHRCFFPRELAALLHYNGFEVLTITGDFEVGPLRPDSESMVFTATLR